MSSTSTSTSGSGSGSIDKLTIDIRPLLEDVSQVMTKHITSILSGVVGEYTVYKETHETIMGLPCVRKLQDRISDLENQLNGGDPASSASASASASAPPTEISELQSAIVDLNRYIQVLETRMNVKNVVSSQQVPEEAIRLEVHENDDASSDANEPDVIIPQSVHTNRIIDTSVVTHDETEATDEDAEEEETVDAEDTEEDAAEEEEEEVADATEGAEEEDTEAPDAVEEEDTEAPEATAEEDAAAEEDTEAPDAVEEEEAVEEEDTEAVEDAEEDAVEDAEEDAEETAEEATPEDAEEEIEVSEIKIKGVTYFTTSAQNGIIYACVDDDVGDEVGVFKNGVALFKNKTAKK